MDKNDIRYPTHVQLLDYEKNWVQSDFNIENENPETVPLFLDFLKNNKDGFFRTYLEHHFTASGFIVNKDMTETLLTHHRKLNDWLQLGGHADGDTDLAAVALKECEEESGMTGFEFFPLELFFTHRRQLPLIFDLDRHVIPARAGEPEHFHYDVRFLLIASHPEQIKVSEESIDLKWYSIDDAFQVAKQSSMHRPFHKILYLKERMKSLVQA